MKRIKELIYAEVRSNLSKSDINYTDKENALIKDALEDITARHLRAVTEHIANLIRFELLCDSLGIE